MDMKIKVLAEECVTNRDEHMRVRSKTKKKIRAFEDWLASAHLRKKDIIEAERHYFSFCKHCKETSYFECRDYELNWRFEIECRCERVKKQMEKDMKERIERYKREARGYEVQRLF